MSSSETILQQVNAVCHVETLHRCPTTAVPPHTEAVQHPLLSSGCIRTPSFPHTAMGTAAWGVRQDDVGGAKKTQNRASDSETGEAARPAQSGLPHERMLRAGGRDYGVVQGWERAVGIPRHHRISSNVTPLCFFCMRTTVELKPLTADGTAGARRRLSRTSSPSSSQRQVVLFFPRRAF